MKDSLNRIGVLVDSTWRTKLLGQVLSIICLISILPLFYVIPMMRDEVPSTTTVSFPYLPIVAVTTVLLLANGLISKERHDGILMTLFARPLRRAEYIIAKWLALVSASSFIVIFIALSAWLTFGVGVGLPVDLPQSLEQFVNAGAVILGSSSVLVAISVFASPFSELFIYLVAWSSVFSINLMAECPPVDLLQKSGWDLWISQAVNMACSFCFSVTNHFDLNSIFFPSIDLLGKPEMVALDTLRLIVLVCASFYIAIAGLNQKELTYGAQ